MTPARLLLGALVRAAVLVTVLAVYIVLLDRSDSTDALSAGLLAFLILVTIAFGWALVDGVRRGVVPALVGWVLTSAVAGFGIPVVIAVKNDTGIVEELGDGALFFGLLLFVPAFVGLAIGGLVHRVRGRGEVPVTG